MLKIRFKNNKQNAVWLVEPKVRIGSGAHNELIVEGESVADTHAEILVEHETLTLVKCAKGSTLRVNGTAVEQTCPLVADDIVSLAGTELQVVDPKRVAKQKQGSKQSFPKVPASAPASAWALKSNHSALKNKVFNVGSNTVVGRSNECDITLAAAHLSRRHARLCIKNDRLRVTDLDSANGTYLNGKRVKEAWVSRGDELRFDTLAFGVIGPADDLDKTTIRPMPAPIPGVKGKTSVKAKPATRVKRSKVTEGVSKGASGRANPKGEQRPKTAQTRSGSGSRIALACLLVLLGLGIYYFVNNFQ